MVDMPTMAPNENPYLMTLPQLMSAKKKIGYVAGTFDASQTSIIRNMFESESLNPSQFREALRRNFGITLTDAELGATIMLFDKDGDGDVSCVEFVNEFLRLGQHYRRKVLHRHQEERRRRVVKYNKRQAEALERRIKLTKVAVAQEYTEEERISATQKIADLAFTYERNAALGNQLQGFWIGGDLDPTTFKQQLWLNFNLQLSPGELAAVMDIFDSDKNGTIDSAEFLFHFFRIGREAKSEHILNHMARSRRRREAEQKRLAARAESFGSRTKAKLADSYTEEDRERALNKVRAVAGTYERHKFQGFSAFETRAMDPTAFREQLRQNFYINLTPAELRAVLDEFDQDGDGTIDSAEFLSAFFRLGQQEKSRVLSRHQKIRARHRREEALRAAEIDRKYAARLETRVDWPKLPSLTMPSTISGDSSTYSDGGDGGALSSAAEGKDLGDDESPAGGGGPGTAPGSAFAAQTGDDATGGNDQRDDDRAMVEAEEAAKATAASLGFDPNASGGAPGGSTMSTRKSRKGGSIREQFRASCWIPAKKIIRLYPGISEDTQKFLYEIDSKQDELLSMKTLPPRRQLGTASSSRMSSAASAPESSSSRAQSRRRRTTRRRKKKLSRRRRRKRGSRSSTAGSDMFPLATADDSVEAGAEGFAVAGDTDDSLEPAELAQAEGTTDTDGKANSDNSQQAQGAEEEGQDTEDKKGGEASEYDEEDGDHAAAAARPEDQDPATEDGVGGGDTTEYETDVTTDVELDGHPTDSGEGPPGAEEQRAGVSFELESEPEPEVSETERLSKPEPEPEPGPESEPDPNAGGPETRDSDHYSEDEDEDEEDEEARLPASDPDAVAAAVGAAAASDAHGDDDDEYAMSSEDEEEND